MCDLCNIFKDNQHITTYVYDRNDDMIVLDCATCSSDGKPVPMAVWREHTMVLSPGDILHIVKVLTALFGEGIHIRFEQKKIQNHLHWHVLV